MYTPFIRYITARRAHLSPGQYYHPFFAKQMIPPPGTPCAFFNDDQELCDFGPQAVYAVYQAHLAPPPGFIPFDCSVNAYGEVIPPPTYNSEEDAIVAWSSQVQPEIWEDAVVVEPTLSEPAHLTALPPSSPPPGTQAAQNDEEEDDFQLLVGKDGYYFKATKSGKTLRATNYVVQLREVQHIIGADGKEITDRRKILAAVVLKDSNQEVKLSVEYTRLGSIVDIIKKTAPEGIIFRYQRIFIEKLDILLRGQLSLCEHAYSYIACGWMELPNGMTVYVHDDVTPPVKGVYFKSGFTFGRGPCTRSNRDIIAAGLSMLNVSDDFSKSVPLFLWAHLGCLWDLFSQAGYPPRALLYLSGVSGSMKTAVSKIIFNFTADPELAIPSSFRATSSSMEVAIEQYRDRVLLVDDFCPAANRQDRRTMEQTLENLIRFFGDGITKGRADPNMNKVHLKKARGLCVITGEDVAGSLSSRLRCLFVQIEKGTFDGTVLKRFQDEPYLWTEYLALFVDSLLAVIPDVVNRIAGDFPKYREQAEQVLKERRLVDIYCCLVITAEIILTVASKLSGGDWLGSLLAKFEQAVLDCCVFSEQRSIQHTPERLFAEALTTLLQRQEVRLGTKEEFVSQPHEYLGVKDGNYWYLWPSETYQAVDRYYNKTGNTLPLSPSALWKALASAGVLVPTEATRKGVPYRENTVKVPFGNRPRLLKINPDKLLELTEPS